MIGIGDIGIGAFVDSDEEQEKEKSKKMTAEERQKITLNKRLHRRKNLLVLTDREQ